MAMIKNADFSQNLSSFNWIEEAPMPVLLYTEDGEVILISKALTASTGYTIEEIPTLEIITEKMFGNKKEEVKQIFGSLFESQLKRNDEDIPVKIKNGQTKIWDLYSSYVGYSTNGRKIALCVAIDETERSIYRNDLVNDKEFLKTTLVSVADGVISSDSTNHVVFMNRTAENLTGWTLEEAKSRSVNEIFQVVDEYTKKRHEYSVEYIHDQEKEHTVVNNRILISKDGIERPIEESASPIIMKNNGVGGVVILFRDYSEQKQRENEIRTLSYSDPLTGVYNRRFYEEELRRLDVERNLPITLLMADINGLKLTNDAFGHDEGDRLIRKIVEILRKECRADDILARIGGDEFVVLLPQTDEKQAQKFLARIHTAIENTITDTVVLSVALGFAVKQESFENMHDIFRKAEDQMYRDKLSESPGIRSRTIVKILDTLYLRNKREMSHSRQVGHLCGQIASKMNFDRDAVKQIQTAGIVHDIGKIGIDASILTKSQKLNNIEWYEIMKHPEIGYRILSSANEFSGIADIVLQHQEKWDGSGYPKGLKGDEICQQARIIGVAEAFDTMMSGKPYTNTYSREKAEYEIMDHAGRQFDPVVAKTFIEKVLDKQEQNSGN